MMACYESCVDLGKKCALTKHKVFCTKCGQLKGHYSLLSEQTPVNPEGEPNKSVEKEERVVNKDEQVATREVWVPYFKYKDCKCKQTCCEWILSFLGLGAAAPECCKRVPLTVWDRGEIARAALASKFQEIVGQIGCRPTPVVKRTSYVKLEEALKESEPLPTDDKESTKENEVLPEAKLEHFGSETSYTLETESYQSNGKAGDPKTRKRRRRKRKAATSDGQQSKLQSAVASLKARSKRPPSSSSSNSLTSNATDLTVFEFFNPFKNRSIVKKCSFPRRFRSLYCPQLPCVDPRRSRSKPLVSRSRQAPRTIKHKVVIQASPKDHPPKKHCACKRPQTLTKCQVASDKRQATSKDSAAPCPNKRKHRVIKSTSMPCTSCFSSTKPFRSRFCKCDPELPCGGPKLPCRSESFHSTLLRSPSPLAVVMPTSSPCCRPCAVSTGRPRCRRFKCQCPLDCITRRSRSCSRSSCCCPIKSSYCSPPPLCKSGRDRSGPYVDKKSPCNLDCCQQGKKPPIPMCPPCCTKPCCLPCPRKFNVFPYCQRVDATSKRYLSIPPCTMRAACPCPTGGPCSCPKARHFPLPCCPYAPSPTCRVACSTPSAVSYIKSKQNDAICQRLLSKYGFSPPMCMNCPAPCYGGASEGICGKAPSCTSNVYSCAGTGSGGCRSCLP